MKVFFKGFNFSQDGPGNRLVYHLQGCNMRCPWCSNPEGMVRTGGSEISVSALVAEAKGCLPMFFSGGGVTFTGGEATLQCDELCEALRLLRAAGIHTALETNGVSPSLPVIEKQVDYLMMDVKHFDADLFLSFTGQPIDALRDNLTYLCGIGRQLHIRIPVINGVNADDALGFVSFFSGLDTQNAVFELLPYHEYGKEKWKGRYGFKNGFVSDVQLDLFRETLVRHGLKVIHT